MHLVRRQSVQVFTLLIYSLAVIVDVISVWILFIIHLFLFQICPLMHIKIDSYYCLCYNLKDYGGLRIRYSVLLRIRPRSTERILDHVYVRWNE